MNESKDGFGIDMRMGHVDSVRRVHVEAFQLSVSVAQTSVALRITQRTFACHSAFIWFLSQYPIGCVQWPKPCHVFQRILLEKLTSNSRFFRILLAVPKVTDFYSFLKVFFSLYLLQVDRACSVADPSNDVSNDSHLASWFILNGHPYHSWHSEHLSLEGGWDMAVWHLCCHHCQPIWGLYNELWWIMFITLYSMFRLLVW